MASFDPTGIASAVDYCKNGETDVDCVKAITNVISVVDPTGLASIAAAFMYPNCPAANLLPGNDEIESEETITLIPPSHWEFFEIKGKQQP